jgi:hypothetical protein
MKYIISGNAVDLVLRENQLRIQRGDLIVTPFEEEAPVQDSKDVVEDTKEVAVTDKKKPVKRSKK